MVQSFKAGDKVVAVPPSEIDCDCEHHSYIKKQVAYSRESKITVGTAYEIDSTSSGTRCFQAVYLTGLGVLTKSDGTISGWCSGLFRKVVKADDEFTALIKACKPKEKARGKDQKVGCKGD